MTTTLDIDVGGDAGAVPGLLLLPPDAESLFVFAHGAGAGMRHRFMESMAEALAAARVGTLRYDFPYMAAGRRRPDPPALAQRTVRAAVERAQEEAPEMPLFAGGKSFGGRMTSGAAAERPFPGVAGLLFLGFPLHPAGRPGTARAEHLARTRLPMLFLQGTRDALAQPPLVREVVEGLGPRARLHEIDGADHSFAVLRRSGRTEEDVRAELVREAEAWMRAVVSGRAP